jgi:serine/threonine protein phosphatase PrpC
MTFDVDIGHASRRGPRSSNEDFAGALSEPGRGLIAAIADGVSSGGFGREAAQTTVMGLLADFFAAPDTWETTVVLDRLIGAQNAWLAAHNRRRDDAAAMTTLTAVALQGHGVTIAHVGDTRAWRLRGGEMMQLTRDHAFDHADFRSRLTRAIGLEDGVRVDYEQGELQVGDVFVLTSDGVHGVLPSRRLAPLAQAATAQQASDAIVDAALAAGSTDNTSALVIHVRGLDASRLEDELARSRRLPVPGRLGVGDVLDRWTVTAVLAADTGAHRLLQVRDNDTRALRVMKTLSQARAGDMEERAMLAHEAWLGMRVTAGDDRGFVRVHDSPDASAFYVVFDWHAGRTLEQVLQDRAPSPVSDVVAGAIEIARALGRLHRHGVVHRDVKPANLHLGADGQWRLIDLGAALSGREAEAQRALRAGTPSYMNPEQWDGAAADAGSDLFALGVTLYRWLARRLPYGEIEPYQTARFRHDPVAPSRIRPDVPIWLEVLLALERGASRPVAAPQPTPLVRSDPVVLLRVGLAVSVLVNVLLVVWLLFLPR